jgi:recombination protein RecR
MYYPKAIENLIEAFRSYPGVGRKTAERNALYTAIYMDSEQIDKIIEAFHQIKEDIHPCPICGNLTDVDPCRICSNQNRSQEVILVVEEAKDIIALEKANSYQGLYHVLNGVINPSRGIGPDDINIKSLLERLKNKHIKEVILATNLSNEGEMTAAYINRLLGETDLVVTRIAHGIPVGGNIEYADEITIAKALEGRRKL